MPLNQPDEPLIAALRTPEFAQSNTPEENVLNGPLGLRAGWGLLFFFVLAVVFFFLLFAGLFQATGRMAEFRHDSKVARGAETAAKAAHRPFVPPPAKVSLTFLAEASEGGAVLLATFALCFVEKRRFRVYGLEPRYVWDALPGAFWGLVSLAVLVGLLRGLHLLVFDGQMLHGALAWRYGVEWLVVFALVGVFEEFFFRGYIQFTLMRGLLGLGARVSPGNPQRGAFWMAAVIWSLLFCLTHLSNAGEDPVGLVMVFVAGILFSYALWRTGSLWWGIGFHMTWDWAQSFLFGVPDSGMVSAGRLFATHAVGNRLLSGGTTGPEGSVYVLPVLLLVGVVLRMHKQRPQPPVEQEGSRQVPGVEGAAAIS
ncbi:MAG TPA: CPBP family intramembrane glutamic endopeptidase [Acidobacteriaceae bacterium]|nr:CPBP family intramembrane glutamic endopeptidase [Acidobacteriaceae bacterium]